MADDRTKDVGSEASLLEILDRFFFPEFVTDEQLLALEKSAISLEPVDYRMQLQQVHIIPNPLDDSPFPVDSNDLINDRFSNLPSSSRKA